MSKKKKRKMTNEKIGKKEKTGKQRKGTLTPIRDCGGYGIVFRRFLFGGACQYRLSSAAVQQCSSAADRGWRIVPDAILPGHLRAPQWVPARSLPVHWGLNDRKTVGGPFQSDSRYTANNFSNLECPEPLPSTNRGWRRDATSHALRGLPLCPKWLLLANRGFLREGCCPLAGVCATTVGHTIKVSWGC